MGASLTSARAATESRLRLRKGRGWCSIDHSCLRRDVRRGCDLRVNRHSGAEIRTDWSAHRSSRDCRSPRPFTRAVRVALLLLLFDLAHVSAQASPVRVTVNGVVYDSLRGNPLQSAFIVIPGITADAISDALGRFRLDSVPRGANSFAIYHPTLDSIGFGGWSVRTFVRDASDTIRLLIPSFATFWRSICGGTKPPTDSGFIFGNVGGQGGRPSPGAIIRLSWLEIQFDAKHGLSESRRGGTVRADTTGAYTVCGVPLGVAIRVSATAESGASGVIDLLPNDSPVRRRDLLLGGTDASGQTLRGVIAGALRDAAGQAVANAEVIADRGPATRSERDGRFLLLDVPAGTRQVDVRSIGMIPIATVVDVVPGDTTRLEIQLAKTALDTVHVLAVANHRLLAREIDERRRIGFGRYLDSTQIAGHADAASALSELPPLRCRPSLWIDARRIDAGATVLELRLLSPDNIGIIEQYRSSSAPPQFGRNPCGLVLIWTKHALRG